MLEQNTYTENNNLQSSQLSMEILDVVYGKITIPSDVAAIVATPQFQRLKYIKQLGFLKLNNGIESNHHRYAHCLGTYHAASLMLNALEKNTEWIQNNNNKIPLVYRKAVLIAALLHDIAHGPFSHAWERVVHDYIHESEAFFCIDNIFEQLNEEQFPELRHNNNFGIELIKSLIEGDIEKFKFKEKISQKFKFIFEIVSNKHSKLDVDKWDYLKRDAFYLKHLSQPNMDFNEVFLMARASECGSHIEYRYEDYDKIYNLFAARYDFHVHCYTLPENLLYDYILNMAIHEIQPKIHDIFVTEIGARNAIEFLEMTDNNLLKLIESSKLSKFFQDDTQFQLVDGLESETLSACVKVKSVKRYMPEKHRIRFYGDGRKQPVLNDKTKCVHKIYTCYWDQRTQTAYYTVDNIN